MAKIYASLIKKHLKTIEDVPTKWKDATLEILKEEGLDGYGNKL